MDDNPTNLKLVSDLLDWSAYRFSRALDAGQALEAIRRKAPDMVLMDIGLPDMDGLTQARNLKADEKTKHIRIVALTACAMKGDEQKALDADCDAYIAKPINTRALRASWRNAFRVARRRGPECLKPRGLEASLLPFLSARHRFYAWKRRREMCCGRNEWSGAICHERRRSRGKWLAWPRSLWTRKRARRNPSFPRKVFLEKNPHGNQAGAWRSRETRFHPRSHKGRFEPRISSQEIQGRAGRRERG